MISHQKLYSTDLDDSLVPHAYKLPSQKESMEVAKAVMQQGDVFAFFQSQDKGSLAVWIPASGDGTVKGSGNTYFSLSGFTSAYGKLVSCVMTIDS